ncbi:N-acyl homoserine lactonase family protein [Desertibaculum subflavum]|uniref:N-acyl homoserine lactonase family protein n=1 Tax=Desertibaculum subflavum TaxID=2268458 RepID=UPI000E6662C5
MTVRMYALECGRLTGRWKDMMEGEEGEVDVPIPAYVIEHPKGTVLFDTGMHPTLQADPASRIGERAARLFQFHYRAGEDVASQIQAIDRDPAKVTHVVNSHLHFDHSGGNHLIPNATLVLQSREYEVGMDAERAAKFGFDRRDIDLGHPVKVVDGEHDLFGDGRIVCLPTYGHTPGHQSLKVRLDSCEVVLTGDACYFCRTLKERRLPRFVYDREAMLASLQKIADMQSAGARIFFGHDADFWAILPKGGQPIS